MNKYFLLILLVAKNTALPYNRPNLCVNARWDSQGITLINGTNPNGRIRGIFIDSDDHFYAIQSRGTALFFWSLDSWSSSLVNISVSNTSAYSSPFITEEKYVYFATNQQVGKIIRQSLNSTHNETVVVFGGECHGLFIDTNNTLYCSLTIQHRIDTIPLNHTSAPLPTVRAGNGTQGSTAQQLNKPWGIFVDTNFDLYVADAMNNRIQVFRSENTTADTIIGPATHANCILQFPTDIILDRDSNVYIADNRNHRIVRVTWIGCQCLVGCSGTSGFSSNQLNISYSLRFDSYGNLFVVDEGNHRVQKFLLTSRCQTSSNQPELCWNATWASNAITFTDNSTIQTEARGIFVDTDDTVYLARYQHGDILRWMKGRNRTNPDHIITGSVFIFSALFVSEAKEIYFETAWQAGRIEKRSVISSSNVFVAQFIDQCRGLFIDVTNTLYCSVHTRHLISSVSLNTNNSGYIIRAGNGSNGSAMNQLDSPWGIFVDVTLKLYVADAQNHRIQCFEANEMNGTTVAGQGFPSGLTLSRPTDVILDGNNHIYIADNNHHRIIKVSWAGYECLLGCSGVFGSGSNQLDLAYGVRFDSYGNLYVSDEYNNRIQTLLLLSNCEGFTKETTHDNHATTPSVVQLSFPAFYPKLCSDPLKMGTFCQVNNTPCEILTPCLNNGSCFNVIHARRGYRCSCANGFTGSECQIYYQSCTSKICFDHGTCQQLINGTHVCQCAPGWQGSACEERIDYCAKISCENQGVCRLGLSDYECLCLGASYSGRHCEIVSKKTIILRNVALSVTVLMILIVGAFLLFILIMDILKYVCGIDLAKVEKKDQQKRRSGQKRPKHVYAIHFFYVNGSSTT